MSMLIGTKVIRETLNSLSGLPETVTDGSIVKIFSENVPENINYPYIVISFQYGGYKYQTRKKYYDGVYKVVCVTANQMTALTTQELIAEMGHIEPVIPSSEPNVCGVGNIEEPIAIFDRQTIQNQVIFQAGGLYRLRMITGEY